MAACRLKDPHIGQQIDLLSVLRFVLLLDSLSDPLSVIFIESSTSYSRPVEQEHRARNTGVVQASRAGTARRAGTTRPVEQEQRAQGRAACTPSCSRKGAPAGSRAHSRPPHSQSRRTSRPPRSSRPRGSSKLPRSRPPPRSKPRSLKAAPAQSRARSSPRAKGCSLIVARPRLCRVHQPPGRRCSHAPVSDLYGCLHVLSGATLLSCPGTHHSGNLNEHDTTPDRI
jgi:hypothetical protein